MINDFATRAAATLLDLSQCASEPIHIPGTIQPHGAMIAALAEGMLITHASANLLTFLGRPAEAVLGRSLDYAIGELARRALLDVGTSRGGTGEQVHAMSIPGGDMLYLRAHQTGRHICVDIEPYDPEPFQRRPIFVAQSVVKTFEHAASVVELCELAVQGLKTISGYDRVMAYRFWGDGHGEVIAEARESSLKSLLGSHYPASDIPAQARRLYMRQRVGAIADSSYVPVPLLTDSSLDDGSPLDLTHSALRSASPVHCEYMRNMKTAASLTIGLAYGPDLWGMLVCHHSKPRSAGFELRAAAELIGQVVSLLLVSVGEAELLAQRIERNTILRALTDRLAASVPLSEAFAAAQIELLHLMRATGCAVRLSGTLVCLGRTPPLPATEAILSTLESVARDELQAVDDLGIRHPEFAAYISEASGALRLALASGDGDAILWFRPELERTIVWGGNPSEHGRNQATGRISPRTSFDAWKETIKSHSAPWTAADLAQAREVRSAIAVETAKRGHLALRESHAKLGLIAEHSSDVIMLVDFDGVRRYVSPAVERLLGWRPEDLVGDSPLLGNAPQAFVHPEDQQALTDARALFRPGSVGEFSVCFRHLRADGSWRWVESTGRTRMSNDGAGFTGIVVAMRDATASKSAEIKLTEALETMERMAATDALTGLANRRHFALVADKEWRRCRRDQRPLSVLLLDVDHFKRFNDRYGHLAGDECLRSVSAQLTVAARRPADLAARFGGEEFLLLMPQTDRDGSRRVAERIRALVLNLAIAHEASEPLRIVTVSIGVATAWPDSGDAESDVNAVSALLAAADAALYQAKSNGRNQVMSATE